MAAPKIIFLQKKFQSRLTGDFFVMWLCYSVKDQGIGRMKLWIEALANLLGNNLFQATHDVVGNFLRELLAAIMTEAFRRTVLEEKLGWVNFQNLGNLVYHIRRRKGVAAFYAVDVVVALVQVDG